MTPTCKWTSNGPTTLLSSSPTGTHLNPITSATPQKTASPSGALWVTPTHPDADLCWKGLKSFQNNNVSGVPSFVYIHHLFSRFLFGCSHDVQEGRWDDSPCNLTLPSICKKPGTKSDGKPQQQDCNQVILCTFFTFTSPKCSSFQLHIYSSLLFCRPPPDFWLFG